MRVFLDTNVILDYVLDSRGEFHAPAVELMRLIAADRLEAGFSTSQATDLYYSLRKAAGDEAARTALRGLFTLFRLYSTPASACVDALDLPIDDYEDAVQIETARANQCGYIITRSLRDFEDSSVPCIDPAGFLAFRRHTQDQ